MNLDDILQIGYKDTGAVFADYKIFMKDDSRVLFNPNNNIVVVEYSINSERGKKFTEEYTNE